MAERKAIAVIDGSLPSPHQGEVLRLLKITFLSLMLALTLACSNDPTSGSQTDRKIDASAPTVQLVGRVTDSAQILTYQQEFDLSEKLEELERSTGHQMVIATVPTLGGQDIAEFTTDLANSWGIGRKDYDDGVVLLIAPNEQKARIAVGLGLERELTDALCQQIMDEKIIPQFRDGDLAGGIDAGADAIIFRLNRGLSSHSPQS
ncbi:TPM domain-containing protein [Altererythrobacter confluentis]|uniref:TPM domain-containing protein n=1 Tax=Allopontixanthobacter confluentis TaxID=1849021 RepID=A0A6L7GJX4_9SPHN|nr:TPM domain-containing protein [Allopontixanthobacter confluentis]MXP15816.1 TPM domain-containing protein [Allopontixanthobacter confluentis]